MNDSQLVNDPMGESQLLNIEEVAAYLRVPVLTIRWLRQELRFPPAFKVGRRLVWHVSDIDEWLESVREKETA